MKEDKMDFQKKKVNRLTLSEAEDMKSLLERSGQDGSRKYQHVLAQIAILKQA